MWPRSTAAVGPGGALHLLGADLRTAFRRFHESATDHREVGEAIGRILRQTGPDHRVKLLERAGGSGGGSAVACNRWKSCQVRPSNGSRPVTIWKSMTPNAYTSDRTSARRASTNYSGAMCVHVPTACPYWVSWTFRNRGSPVSPCAPTELSSRAFASPKSVTLSNGVWVPVMRLFSGLTSRCTRRPLAAGGSSRCRSRWRIGARVSGGRAGRGSDPPAQIAAVDVLPERAGPGFHHLPDVGLDDVVVGVKPDPGQRLLPESCMQCRVVEEVVLKGLRGADAAEQMPLRPGPMDRNRHRRFGHGSEWNVTDGRVPRSGSSGGPPFAQSPFAAST